MVDGYVEEALYLVRVEVHRYQAVDACNRQQVGHELRTYRDARLVFTVLACPAKVRYNSHDAFGRRALGGVNHQQQLHQVVRVGEGGLNQEHVCSPDGLLVRHGKLAIRKVGNVHLTQGAAQACANFLCQVSRISAREYHKRCFFAHFVIDVTYSLNFAAKVGKFEGNTELLPEYF